MGPSIALPVVHPAAELFPLMEDKELQQLSADIVTHGQLQPCEMFGGKLLDGRNRWIACGLAGITPMTREIETTADFDPWAYVTSKHLLSRQITKAQRALAAARLLDHERSLAKERQRQGQEKLPDPELGQARDKAGKRFGVSGKTVEKADKVIAQGVAGLVALVERSEVSISAAETFSGFPRARQEKLITDGARGVNQSVKRALIRSRGQTAGPSDFVYKAAASLSTLRRALQGIPNSSVLGEDLARIHSFIKDARQLEKASREASDLARADETVDDHSPF
jgi:hypothetical protein